MKWINGFTADKKMRMRIEKREAQIKALNKWHRWFAWRPICVEITAEHRQVKVWLEWVERSGIRHHSFEGTYMTWEYREIGKETR